MAACSAMLYCGPWEFFLLSPLSWFLGADTSLACETLMLFLITRLPGLTALFETVFKIALIVFGEVSVERGCAIELFYCICSSFSRQNST